MLPHISANASAYGFEVAYKTANMTPNTLKGSADSMRMAIIPHSRLKGMPRRLMERYVKKMRPQMREVTRTLKVVVKATHGTPRLCARPEKSDALGNALSTAVNTARVVEATNNNAGRIIRNLSNRI